MVFLKYLMLQWDLGTFSLVEWPVLKKNILLKELTSSRLFETNLLSMLIVRGILVLSFCFAIASLSTFHIPCL